MGYHCLAIKKILLKNKEKKTFQKRRRRINKIKRLKKKKKTFTRGEYAHKVLVSILLGLFIENQIFYGQVQCTSVHIKYRIKY